MGVIFEEREPKEDVYDLEAAYDAEVSPLAAQLHEVCSRLGMPFVLYVQYEHSEGTDGIATTCHIQAQRSHRLHLAYRLLHDRLDIGGDPRA